MPWNLGVVVKLRRSTPASARSGKSSSSTVGVMLAMHAAFTARTDFRDSNLVTVQLSCVVQSTMLLQPTTDHHIAADARTTTTLHVDGIFPASANSNTAAVARMSSLHDPHACSAADCRVNDHEWPVLGSAPDLPPRRHDDDPWATCI